MANGASGGGREARDARDVEWLADGGGLSAGRRRPTPPCSDGVPGGLARRGVRRERRSEPGVDAECSAEWLERLEAADAWCDADAVRRRSDCGMAAACWSEAAAAAEDEEGRGVVVGVFGGGLDALAGVAPADSDARVRRL